MAKSPLLALLPAFEPRDAQARQFVPGPGPLVDALAARGVRAETDASPRTLALRGTGAGPWARACYSPTAMAGATAALHAHGAAAS